MANLLAVMVDTLGIMDTSEHRAREFSRAVARHLSAEGKRLGVTQQQIAEASGFGAEQFSYYLAGTRGLMTVGALLRAAERLSLDPKLIVERAYEDLLRDMGGPHARTAAATPADTNAVPARPAHGRTQARARGGRRTR